MSEELSQKSLTIDDISELTVKDLREVKEAFDSLGIICWLDWGTLLGAVRDGRMIRWDHDVDLGIIDNDLKKTISIIPELRRRGFHVEGKSLKFYRNFSLTGNRDFSRYGCSISIWPYHKGKHPFYSSHFILPESYAKNKSAGLLRRTLLFLRELLLSHEVVHVKPARSRSKYRCTIRVLEYLASSVPPKFKETLYDIIMMMGSKKILQFYCSIIPEHYFERLETIRFYGMTFNIPSNVRSYLRYHYGEDWETPKKKWDWLHQDGSIRILTAQQIINLFKED